jgi:hypothetical protein
VTPQIANPDTARSSVSGRRLSRQRLLETFVSNLFIGYLVITGRIQPLSLIALVAIEALLLVAVQAMQMRFIPASAVPREFRGSIAAQFGGLLFALVVVVLANWLIISVATKAGGSVLSILWHPLDAVRHSQLGWPLAVTLALALLNARDDVRWHAAHGGDFVSTPGLRMCCRSRPCSGSGESILNANAAAGMRALRNAPRGLLLSWCVAWAHRASWHSLPRVN